MSDVHVTEASKNLCCSQMKWTVSTIIPFLVTKRGQILIWISVSDLRLAISTQLYRSLSDESEYQNIY